MDQDPWNNAFMFEQLTKIVVALIVDRDPIDDTHHAVDIHYVDRAIRIQQLILDRMEYIDE